ncbi:MAG: sensor histidine kinase [Bryobacteraceae bacterium]
MSSHYDSGSSKFREAALRVIEASQAESATVSRLLHDDVAQLLSAAGLQLDILRMDLEPFSPEIAGPINEIQRMLDDVVSKLRTISQSLGSINVERFGLRAGLDWLVGRHRAGFSGKLRLHYDAAVSVPQKFSRPLFRIAEQALENAVRHSRAQQIEVLLKPGPGGGCLEVRDDGIGFEPEQALHSPEGLGVPMMHFIARRSGFSLSIERTENPWTCVRVAFFDNQTS